MADPATTEVHVGIDAEESTAIEIHVYGAGGGEVLSWKGEGDAYHAVTLNVATLAPGSYLLVVRYNGADHSLRFVKKSDSFRKNCQIIGNLLNLYAY